MFPGNESCPVSDVMERVIETPPNAISSRYSRFLVVLYLTFLKLSSEAGLKKP